MNRTGNIRVVELDVLGNNGDLETEKNLFQMFVGVTESENNDIKWK